MPHLARHQPLLGVFDLLEDNEVAPGVLVFDDLAFRADDLGRNDAVLPCVFKKLHRIVDRSRFDRLFQHVRKGRGLGGFPLKVAALQVLGPRGLVMGGVPLGDALGGLQPRLLRGLLGFGLTDRLLGCLLPSLLGLAQPLLFVQAALLGRSALILGSLFGSERRERPGLGLRLLIHTLRSARWRFRVRDGHR